MKKLKHKIKSFYAGGDHTLKLLDQQYLPRWVVILIDALIAIYSFAIVVLLLNTTPIKLHTYWSIFQQGLFIIICTIISFFIFKTYSGIIRHSTFTDIIKLAFSALFTFLITFSFNLVYEKIVSVKIFLNTSLFIYTLVSFSGMLLYRILVKEAYQFFKNISSNSLKKNVIIVGLNDQTISIGNAIANDSKIPFNLKGFVTNKMETKRLKLHGKPVIPIKESFKDTIANLDVEGILLISESFSKKLKNEIVEDCLSLNLKIFNVPGMEQWNKKEDITTQIKPIQIEDLLEREEINIDNQVIHKDLQGKTILVTGGAGSIGSEIVKQVAGFNPKLVIILDQAESALHDLELFLLQNFENLNFETKLANISNMYRMEMLFDAYDFDIVYHAAAYKHVPLIERNPHEGIFVNILGTVNLSVLAVSHKIERFVMVSTDKAVNPTNVMGASKRAAEMYVQSLQHKNALEDSFTTKFITTRFGNVLGSNGSVIPNFRKQIAEGGPVTVTHKDIIRYFMTIPEACQLVLQAGTMGKGGEIFLFDMGKPVKILNLAKRMIKLSGFIPYEDIDIKITGLRPGEKLFEELLNNKATTQPTHHPKIMISKEKAKDFDEVNGKIKQIIKYASRFNDEKVVKELKELIPEFISNNSLFEVLDEKK